MNPIYYHPVYLYSMLFITLGCFFYFFKKNTLVLYDNSNNIFVLLYILFLMFFLGLRPLSGVFVDTMNYAGAYYDYQMGVITYHPDSKEWLFEFLMYSCSKIMDVQSFFLIVEILYILPVIWACYKLVPNHYLVMCICVLGAFSFYSYGVNGIRNGVACSFVIASLALINGSLKEKILATLCCIIAFNIHRTTALPIFCMSLSFFIKDVRYIMGFWFFSILLSLIAGSTIENFFVNLGFDDRMEKYSSSNMPEGATFSSIGFRWDFLLYSSMPIILGFYVIFIRKVWDKTFLLLLNTYILSNSFWVMMIRASFSNRFAYLSWFMYGVVVAYPCLKLPISRNQGTFAALILFFHFAFTFVMYEVVYKVRML